MGVEQYECILQEKMFSIKVKYSEMYKSLKKQVIFSERAKLFDTQMTKRAESTQN